MIALVERLIERGVAYQAEDGSIYFAIAKFPAYGKLSRLDTREIKTGARVRAGRLHEGERAGLRALEGGEARGRAHRRRVGFAVGARAPGLASRVLGDGDGVLSARRSTFTAAASTSSSRITRTRSRRARRRPGSRSRACGATASSCSSTGAKMAKRVGNVLNVEDAARGRRLGVPRSATSCSRRTTGSS